MAQLCGQPPLQCNDIAEPRPPRSACERCRAHKLKCIRSSTQGYLSQCDRCAKAGSDCHTSASLPPGRPRLDHESASPATPATKRKASDKLGTRSLQRAQPEQASLLRPTLQDDFDTGLVDEMPQAIADGTRAEPSNAIFPSSNWTQSGPLIMDQSLIADMTPGIDPSVDFMSFPGLPAWTDLGQLANFSFPAPIDKNRYHLEKLADLNATLLKLVADDNGPVSTGAQPDREVASVGQMLAFLEDFHSIVKYYLLTIPIRSAPRLVVPPELADSDDDSDPEFAENTTNLNVPLISLVTDSQEKKGLDYPTVLALCTCYMSLIRLYRNWLQNMLSTLDAAAPPMEHYVAPNRPNQPVNQDHQDCSARSATCDHLRIKVPHVLPGAQLEGFQLGNYRSLQISVFMQVSIDLLWRVERAVAALVATDCVGSQATSSNLPLLKTMLQQEARTSKRPNPVHQQRRLDDGDAIGLQSLKILVRAIRKRLRSDICLQLEEGMPDLDTLEL